MEAFITNYGYLAILLGAIFEGEMVLLMGGFAAYAGFLDLPWVIVVAFLGTLFADQAFFFLGRRHSERILNAWPSWRVRMNRAESLFRKFRTPLILFFRFLYGVRAVLVFVIGMSPITTTKFAIFNAFGAMIWAVSIGASGYLFGSAIETLMGKVKAFELGMLGAVAIAGSFIWATRFLRRSSSS